LNVGVIPLSSGARSNPSSLTPTHRKRSSGVSSQTAYCPPGLRPRCAVTLHSVVGSASRNGQPRWHFP
jgi:hypothetical protein